MVVSLWELLVQEGRLRQTPNTVRCEGSRWSGVQSVPRCSRRFLAPPGELMGRGCSELWESSRSMSGGRVSGGDPCGGTHLSKRTTA